MAISDFLEYMPHTITYQEYLGRSDYGEPSYGSPIEYRARVIYKPSFVRAADGSRIVARGYIWFGTAITVSVEDRVYMPDGTTAQIVMVELMSDEDGLHHTKIYFG